MIHIYIYIKFYTYLYLKTPICLYIHLYTYVFFISRTGYVHRFSLSKKPLNVPTPWAAQLLEHLFSQACT